jgi:hypothetical protein
MKARFLSLAAVALIAACGGGGEQQAGDSVEPGPTGTIESTGPQTTTSTPADTMTATSGSTAGGAANTP